MRPFLPSLPAPGAGAVLSTALPLLDYFAELEKAQVSDHYYFLDI